jgi:predicted Zn-dependent protease
MFDSRIHSAARLALAAAAGCLLAGCATNMELEATAAQQFEMIRENSALVQDRRTIDYVACVANAIVAELEPPDSDMYWELAVVDNPTVNAFVMPGGKIVVFSGILTVAENQHQLAAVMGHEVAHVTEGHPQERAMRQEATNFGADTLGLILGGGYAQQTNAAMGSLRTLGQLGILNPFSRGQETEADLVGLEFMARAGFDPRESVELWKTMNEKNPSAIPEYMSTHPSGDTRIERLIGHYPTSLALYNEAVTAGKAPNCQR